METFEYDGSSSSSSSSSSQSETTKQLLTSSSTSRSKRKSGRKKFKETRHPVYKGVRLRNGSKWVCEIHEPNKKSRIWLGTFPTPEMAARAYDAAALALHGDDSPLNFTDSARLIRRAKSCSPNDIQEAALEAALAFGTNNYVDANASSSSVMESGDKNLAVDVAQTSFVDEEVLFNTPSFYNSMAEGLVITPPGMKKGFDWSDDCDSNMDLTLWRY
ncbi:putative transcription factor AP2-EREBP family [Helianthus annuus]|nr:putative transcription factor AP2-EREBP family [Helianthus annuus]